MAGDKSFKWVSLFKAGKRMHTRRVRWSIVAGHGVKEKVEEKYLAIKWDVDLKLVSVSEPMKQHAPSYSDQMHSTLKGETDASGRSALSTEQLQHVLQWTSGQAS